jgi:putative transposase
LATAPNPDGAFVVQAVRGLLGETDTVPRERRILLCDRDPNWTSAMEAVISTVGVRVVRTPPASPNCNAHAECFVRSIKEECLDRIVPLGELHLRRLVRACSRLRGPALIDTASIGIGRTVSGERHAHSYG